MIETWAKKAQQSIGGFGWQRILPPGVWIAIAVAALFGGRVAWAHNRRPPHLKAMTAAYGAITILENPPQFSHDQSKFTYVTATQTRGVGIFLCDRASGEKRLLDTQTVGTGDWRDTFNLRALPWAPDDRTFAYCALGSLTICPVDPSQPSKTIPLDTNGFLSALVWLNASELVWADKTTLGHAKKSPSGPWTVEKFPAPGQAASLVALDTHTVAWTQDGYLCRHEFGDDAAASAASASAFSASTFSAPLTNGLVLWLDASALRLPNAAPVESLSDLSPRRNSAARVQNPPTFNAPSSKAALNGLGTIHFDGNPARGLATARNVGIAGNAPRSVFAVERRGWSFLMGFGNSGGSAGSYFGLCDQNEALYLPATVGTVTKISGFPGNWNILTATYDGATLNGLVNGVLKCSAPFKLDTAESPFEIGIRTSVNSGKTKTDTSSGDLGEILVYNRCLGGAEREQVEKYLSAKWVGTQHLSSDSPLVWINTGMDNIAGLEYSKASGKFLIHTTNTVGGTLWVFTPNAGDPATNMVKIAFDRVLADPHWAGPSNALFTGDYRGRRKLYNVGLDGKSAAVVAEFPGLLSVEPVPGGKAILWGTISNEPTHSVWEYDLASKTALSVLPYSQHPSQYAREIKSSTGVIKLPSGTNVTVTVFYPLAFDPAKKYPVILGDTVVADALHGIWVHSGISGGGAFVILANRRWWPTEIERWEEHVSALRDVLKSDPSIDTDRVFLFSSGSETQFMSQFIEKAPECCAGAIFFGPGYLPNFSKSPKFQKRPRIYLSAGGEEYEERQFQQYQREAIKTGALVEYSTHSTETLRFFGVAGKEARLQALNHFIFEE